MLEFGELLLPNRTLGEGMSTVDVPTLVRRHNADSSSNSGRSTAMSYGIAVSLALHVLVLLLIALSWLRTMPVLPPQPISVNLVRLGPKTISPPLPQTAVIPQTKTETTQRSQTPHIVPAPAMTRQPEPLVVPQPPAAPKTAAQQKKAGTPTMNTPAPHPTIAVARAHRPSANEELAARLKLLARLHLTTSGKPRRTQQHDEAGLSNMTVASADALHGEDSSYAVKDFIRAQVERHWNLDRQSIGSRDWIVAIRITLRPDGTVRHAQIVDNSHLRSDSNYQDFARSARNAVILSSPLSLPPGSYALARDIVVDFDAKQVAQ